MSNTNLSNEVNKLADFLIKNYPQEVGANGSESAVEVAIRLLSK